MFPCATDHDAGTYYPHLKKKAQVWSYRPFSSKEKKFEDQK